MGVVFHWPAEISSRFRAVSVGKHKGVNGSGVFVLTRRVLLAIEPTGNWTDYVQRTSGTDGSHRDADHPITKNPGTACAADPPGGKV